MLLGSDWRHHDIVFQFRSRLPILSRPGHKFNNQRVLHSEHRVVVEVLAVFVEDLCSDRFETLGERLGARELANAKID
jgi:hypothetical protein